MKRKAERYSRSKSSSSSSPQSPSKYRKRDSRESSRAFFVEARGRKRENKPAFQEGRRHQEWHQDNSHGSLKGSRGENHRHRHRGPSSDDERNLGARGAKQQRPNPPSYEQPPPLPAFLPLPTSKEESTLHHQEDGAPHRRHTRRPRNESPMVAGPHPPKSSQRVSMSHAALHDTIPSPDCEDSPPQYSARENEFVVPLVNAVIPLSPGPAAVLQSRPAPPNLRSQFELPAFSQPSPSPLDLTPRASPLMEVAERNAMGLPLLASPQMRAINFPLAPQPFLFRPQLPPAGWAAHMQPLLLGDLPPPLTGLEPLPPVEEDPDYGLIDPSVPLPREDPYGVLRPPPPPPPPPPAPLISPPQKVSPKSPIEEMIDQETEELWESLEVIATPQKPTAVSHTSVPSKPSGSKEKALKHGADAFLEEVLPNITDTWNAEVMEEYRSALEEDLTPDNPQRKAVIASLTSIAKESKHHYREVMSAIITRLVESDARGKESLWCLIDSICRTMGGRYQSAFDQVLLKLVENQMPTPEAKLYERYAKLIDSWAKVFPEKVVTARLLLQQQMPDQT
eukprot:GGOE01002590.1.p1 GENE.GGOE01002590.1~~GGOE01002590.1.p1  ORF type:complete len:565 (-),score=81.94 GGOE01002590.1:190-1884(-)